MFMWVLVILLQTPNSTQLVELSFDTQEECKAAIVPAKTVYSVYGTVSAACRKQYVKVPRQ